MPLVSEMISLNFFKCENALLFMVGTSKTVLSIWILWWHKVPVTQRAREAFMCIPGFVCTFKKPSLPSGKHRRIFFHLILNSFIYKCDQRKQLCSWVCHSNDSIPEDSEMPPWSGGPCITLWTSLWKVEEIVMATASGIYVYFLFFCPFS